MASVTIALVGSGQIGVAKYFIDMYGANPSTVNFAQALVSHLAPDGWWQYAAWYAPNNAVMLARRGPDEVWSSPIALPFGLNVNDSHNSINLGISAIDGRLHVCAGQHNDPMQYTRSHPGLLDDGSAPWSAASFEPVSGSLAGTVVGELTYPTFTAKPDGGLLFWYRNGLSSNGRMRLAEYDGSSWALLGDVTSSTGSWTAPNNGAVSISRNFYWAHPMYGPDGVLHLSATWNEGNAAVLQVPTAPVIQHHIVYVTSADHGRTWYNSAGAKIATTGSDPIHVNKTGIHVPASTVDTRYALLVPDLTLGPDGLVAVLADYVSPDLLTNSPKHVVDMDHRVQYAGNHPRWRNPNGTWDAESVRVDGQFVFNRYPTGRRAATRGKVVFGPDKSMHVVHSGVRICSATAASGYTDWEVTLRGQNYLYAFGEMGGIDRSRPDRFSLLYIEQAETGATRSAVCVRDFQLST
jgi:hypothetical protein